MEPFYCTLDRRSKDGTLLRYEAIRINSKLAVGCANELKKLPIYELLRQAFDQEKLDLYFELYFYKALMPVGFKIAIHHWHKTMELHVNRSTSRFPKKYGPAY